VLPLLSGVDSFSETADGRFGFDVESLAKNSNRLVKIAIILFDDLVEKRFLGPVVLIAKSTGARTGVSCRDDSRHDSL
jgi:hypothetical protein